MYAGYSLFLVNITDTSKCIQFVKFRGRKSRNKVSVGEPAEGSLRPYCNDKLRSNSSVCNELLKACVGVISFQSLKNIERNLCDKLLNALCVFTAVDCSVYIFVYFRGIWLNSIVLFDYLRNNGVL